LDKVLITGGSGFIGSYLTKTLVSLGFHVKVFDNNFRGNFKKLYKFKNNIDLINGDIRNIKEINKALKNIDTVFHLASINGTDLFYKKPNLVLEVGVKGIINLLDCLKKKKIKNFFYASSSEIYNLPKVIPTPEDVPATIPDLKNPRFSYGGSKIIGELLCQNYLNKQINRSIIFRPHNIYGPDMGWNHVIPEIIKKICLATNKFQKKEANISIQGSGLETRSFCFISDFIDGLLLCYRRGLDNNVYNIGNDSEVTIRDLISEISKALDIKVKFKIGKLKEGSANRRCPDITKIKKIGFKPKILLRDGIEITAQWYKNKILKNEK